MTTPPRPDKMPGPIKYKKPTGKKEDSKVEQLHQESNGAHGLSHAQISTGKYGGDLGAARGSPASQVASSRTDRRRRQSVTGNFHPIRRYVGMNLKLNRLFHLTDRVLMHIEHEIPPNRVEIEELRKLLTEVERETRALQAGKSSS